MISATKVLAELRSIGVRLSAVDEKLRYEAPAGVITPAIRDALRVHKAELLSLLGREALRPLARDSELRASFAQMRLWFLDQLESGSATYNVPLVLRLEGALDPSVLERALQALVERHETLRTTFVAVDGEPRQVIHDSFDLRLARVETATEDEAREAVAREIHTPFDLANGPLVRATLVRLDSKTHILVVCIHHIATDAWSNGILLGELTTLYAAFAAGRASPLAAQAIDYADFAAWQRGWLTGEVLDNQLAYWKEHLKGAPAALELPTDKPRPAVKQYVGGTIVFAFPASVSEGVRALCRREGTTPFMVLLAAYQSVLSRWSGQPDVVVGTAIANRTRQELEGIVGFFVNTLAMRTTFDAESSFADVLRRVKESSLSAYAHQDVPFEKLVDELKIARDMSRTPIFQALFIMQNNQSARLKLGDVVAKEESVGLAVAKFDVSLAVEETSSGFVGALDYDVALFDRATMERFVEHLGVFLEAAVRTPDERVASLPLLPESERLLLREWNATTTDEPCDVTVCDLFTAQCRRTPDAIAVEHDGVRLSYRELEDRADRIAAWLIARGVGEESRVAISVERSADMLAATLGVLKAGGAYVPIDPHFPEDRCEFMRRDSGCVAEISAETLIEALATKDAAPLARSHARAGGLAYVLYTSGSTGRPKGVMVEHRALANFLRSMQRAPGVVESDVLVAVTTLAFDIAGLELYLPLISGARVVIASRDVATDPKELSALLERTGATFMQATPATWRMLSASGWRPSPKLKMLCGGEAVGRDLVDVLAEGGNELWNMYGPTETTIWSTCIRLSAQSPITIGRPIANTEIYILDRRGEPTPIGVPGELCIAGAGVARGYLGRAELTAEKFVPNAFSDQPGARMYATGDLARFRSDGTLEYLSRIDTQVKVRGFRIELGEIEAVLAACAGIGEAVVVARGEDSDKRLVAYVVLRGRGSVELQELKTQLAAKLPDYMIPSAFVVLDAMPLTPNGKVDRKALPAPDFSAAAEAYVPPRNAIEEQLAVIFADVLKVARVGIHDNFFALGGHSLLAMRVIAFIFRDLGLSAPVREIMAAPTVAGLAAYLSGSSHVAPPPIERLGDDTPPALSFVQEILVAFERARGPSVTWNAPLRLDLRGPVHPSALREAILLTLERQDSLRMVYDPRSGPRLLSPSDIPCEVLDMSKATNDEVGEFCDRQVNAVPFTFDGAPLIRFFVIQRSREDYVLLVTWHAFVHDPPRGKLLADELLAAYQSVIDGAQLAPLPVRYVDYVAWERAWFAGGGQDEVLGARKRLETMQPLDLSELRPTGPLSTTSITRGFEDVEALAGLERISKSLLVTPATVFTAVVAAFLSRWSGREDVAFMSPVNLHNVRPEIERLCGRFGNTLPIQISTRGNPPLGELIARARASILDAHNFESAPAPLVFGTTETFDHPMSGVIYNTPLIAHRESAPAPKTVGLVTVTEPDMRNVSGARNPLLVLLGTNQKAVFGVIRGAEQLFRTETIANRAAELHAMLTRLDPDARISQLGIK